MTDAYILNTEDFTYELFSDKGFSGKILLAAPKSAGFPKLLVKSENPSSACNEFMYSRLAELLCIPTPKAYIVNVAKKKKRLFASPYVVGIEYMDGFHRFELSEMLSSPMWKREYAGQFALSAMFEQDDLVQMAMTADGHIVGFDFTETFWLSDISVDTFRLHEDRLTDLLAGRLRASENRGFSMLSAGGSVVMSKFGTDTVPEEYLEPMRAMYALEKENIVELLNTLDEVYSIPVSVYFEEYLVLLKKKIAVYFDSIGEKL